MLVSLSSEEMAYADNTTVIDGMKYIYDYAESVGKPCVIHHEPGKPYRHHTAAISTFDRMADSARSRRLLVGSVGNEAQGLNLAAHFGRTPTVLICSV